MAASTRTLSRKERGSGKVFKGLPTCLGKLRARVSEATSSNLENGFKSGTLAHFDHYDEDMKKLVRAIATLRS